jgi:hypothetical protein
VIHQLLCLWRQERLFSENACGAIADSSTCVVFITANYIAKVSGENMADNCKKEFLYADRRKTAKQMIPVMMEAADGKHAEIRSPVSREH